MMQPPLKVNLLARDNGLGLSRDVRLLADALSGHGCEVHVTGLDEADERRRWHLGKGWRARYCHWRHAASRRFGSCAYDVNVMFEHIWPWHLPLARQNVALPNPEWFDAKDMRHLRRMDHIWAKTRHAQQLFEDLGRPTTWIGFDSADHLDPGVARQKKFFHLAGGSRIKGTERLLAVWRKHPEWPPLTVLQHPATAQKKPSPANLIHRAEYLSPGNAQQAGELIRLQNEHRFHLCTSETDGWGHYLVEAMGVGAVPITVDAPPMNELVQPDRGLLLGHSHTGTMGIATTYFFDEAALENAVLKALSLSDETLASMGSKAREWFEHNHAGFARRVGHALARLRQEHPSAT